MAYVGQGIKGGTFSVLDTSGNTYNGSNVTFNLGTHVSSPAQLIVSHDGVIQKPVTDYTLATGGTQITFTTAPASGASIFITEISGAVGAPMNRDINGDELILDADADTSITADTDDQIDVRVGGTDQITIKDGALSPVTDNDIDLGTSSLEFKDAYFDGTVTSDAGLFDTLGVGTARDLGTLHVRSADSGGGANTSADELVVEGSGHAGMTILSGNTNQGGIYFGDDGDDNIGYIVYNHNGNSMSFAANASEMMRLTSDGDLIVGGTALNAEGGLAVEVNAYNGATRLSWNRASGQSSNTSVVQEFRHATSVVGSISHTNSSTTFATSSDYRLKENVSYTWDATTRLKQLKPARFNFKVDKDKDDEVTRIVDGFLAHEVSGVVPEAVVGEKDGAEMQGIDQAKIVPLLVKTIQELEIRIKTLEDA